MAVTQRAIALSFFNILCLMMMRSFLSTIALEVGANEMQIGLATGAYSIIQVILTIPAGKLIDRLGPRRPALFGAVSYIVSAIGLIFAASWQVVSVCAILLGMGHMLLTLTTQEIAVAAKLESQRANNVGMLSFANSGGQFLGPLVTGFLLNIWGRGAFAASAVVGVISLCFALTLPPGLAVIHPAQSSAETPPNGGGTMSLLRDKRVLLTISVSAVVIFCQETLITYFPLYAAELGMSTAAIGIIFSVRGMAMMLIRPFLQPLLKKFGYPLLLGGCLLLGGLSIVANALFHGYYALLCVAALSGLFLGLSLPLTIVLVAESTIPQQRGSALSLRMMALFFGQSISPIIFGALSLWMGLAPVFWVSGTLMMAYTLAAKKMKKPASGDQGKQ